MDGRHLPYAGLGVPAPATPTIDSTSAASNPIGTNHSPMNSSRDSADVDGCLSVTSFTLAAENHPGLGGLVRLTESVNHL